MAKAIIARRQGDEFQAIFFWKQLVNLLIDNNFKKVIFESDREIFVDDIVVEYSKPMIDQYTGQQFHVDAYQCKYHVARSTTFSIDKLIDPHFLRNKQSMLQRLYQAYRKYSEKGEKFRLHIVSSSAWDTQDSFSRFLAPESYIRPGFWENGPRSEQGKIRKKLTDHLAISDAELRDFLDLARFDLGLSRNDILETLDANLRLAGLFPLDRTITSTRYAEIAWKWFEQGTNSFDKQLLNQAVHREKLVDMHRKTLVIIRHQSLDPIVPEAICDDLPAHLRDMAFNEVAIDLTHLFRDGKLTDPRTAISEQLEIADEIRQLYKTSSNIELAYYGIAHIPLVFLLGFQLISRKSINLFEHDRRNNKWDLLQANTKFPELIVRNSLSNINDTGTDIVIKFGISYPIMDVDLDPIVPLATPIIELTLPSPKLDTVTNIEQLESYALSFRGVLDEIHNLRTKINRVHVFYAGPVSLAFRCGQMISPTIHPKVLVYNYFSRDEPKYRWGICVNAPINSSEFLFQF